LEFRVSSLGFIKKDLMNQSTALSEINIGQWITKWASLRPREPAVIFEDSVLTYQQLNARTNQASNLFLNMGIKKGDRVAVLLHNSNIYIEIYFALAKIGAIFVPLNFRLTKPELEFILTDSDSETLISGDEFVETVAAMRPNIPVKGTNYLFLGRTVPSWALDYEKSLGSQSDREPETEGPTGGENPHMIM
jgi:fatty-acyl-CoA synthase